MLSPGYFPAYRAPAVELDGGIRAGRVSRRRNRAGGASRPSGDAEELEITAVSPADGAVLADLLVNIDGTYFQPHPMNALEAQRIATLRGRDIFLIGWVQGVGVVYGLLRGFDEGFEVPSLGLGVRRYDEGRGHGRAMMTALHAAARAGGPSDPVPGPPGQHPGGQLYRAVGYVEAGMERNEIVMAIDLQEP